jgi:N-acyl-D-aspartate/D-glutamate deacylase
MGRTAARAVEAGALGFSTSRSVIHKSSRGAPTPSFGAARDELVGIAAAIGATGTGVLQVVSDLVDLDDEMNTFLAMMRASGRPLSLSLPHRSPDDPFRRTLAAISDANAEGLEMRAVVAPRAIGVLVDVQGSVNPWAGSATFRAGSDLTDADVKRQILADVAEAGGVRVPLERIFELGDPPDYEPDPSASIAARAVREQREPAELLYDVLLRGPAYMPVLNYFDGNLDSVAEMLAHPHSVPGLGDGGAHVATISDASFPTTLLTHWARDRTRGAKFDLEWIVGQQTRATAEAVGLLDRGVVAPGYKADVNVIDFERLHAEPPRIVADLPAGGRRVLQGAQGYLHTFVTGVEVYADGDPTGELPGQLVRGAQATPA